MKRIGCSIIIQDRDNNRTCIGRFEFPVWWSCAEPRSLTDRVVIAGTGELDRNGSIGRESWRAGRIHMGWTFWRARGLPWAWGGRLDRVAEYAAARRLRSRHAARLRMAAKLSLSHCFEWLIGRSTPPRPHRVAVPTLLWRCWTAIWAGVLDWHWLGNWNAEWHDVHKCLPHWLEIWFTSGNQMSRPWYSWLVLAVCVYCSHRWY
jgi:hypothetical protein